MKDWGRDTFAGEYNDIVWKDGDLDMKNTLNPLMIKLIDKVKGKKILDLACGNGYFSFLLESKWAEVIGIDISPKLISFAKKSANKLKAKTVFFVADAANLKILGGKQFDVIVSNMAFMDIKNIEKTMKECDKHLVKNGILLFSISNPIYGVSERVFDEKSKKYYLQIEKYGTCYDIKQKNFGTIHHHRPVGFYLNALINNWFDLTTYQEIPTPYHQGKIMKDKALIKYKKEFPSFLIIWAKKK